MTAAVAVAADAYFSAQEGYLSRAPDYDGVSYLASARSVYELLTGGHLRSALAALNSSLAPLWVAAMDFQQLLLGGGTWQSFTARFWPVALLLLLVWWIVSERAGATIAWAAVLVTAVLPIASAAVRASSFEYFTRQANYSEQWGLEDMRPNFFAIVLAMWAIAALAEHHAVPRRSSFIVSGAFAAAAVLAKPSTGPYALAGWGLALATVVLMRRRQRGILVLGLSSAATCLVLLLPWAIKGGVRSTVSRDLANAVTFGSAYTLGLDVWGTISYYALKLPEQLGVLEVWVVVAAVAIVVAGPLRRGLRPPEWIYLAMFLLYYVAFTATSIKDSFVAFWVGVPLWILFVASASRVAGPAVTAARRFRPRTALGVAAVYVLAVYALGAVALANWPANERQSNEQLASVTEQIAGEMRRYVSPAQCFAYAPGPGWPGSLEYLMTDSHGRSPSTTPVDVDPKMPVSEYVRLASRCPAVLVYREDISEVSRMFVAYPVRQPYLRAVAEWVRTPQSGYSLKRSWRFSDLAGNGPHTLGRFEGITLTVDLYVRNEGG